MSVKSASLMASLFLLAGCGMDSAKPLPNLVPVTGTVTYKGEPLNPGTVAFAPVDIEKCQSAMGKIENGTFEMLTTVSSPGVQVGNYRVAITSLEINSSIPAEMPPAGTELPAPQSLIPENYTDVETSGLEIEVVPDLAPLSYELKD